MEAPECEPDDVDISLHWELVEGALRGEVEVRNVGSRACRLSNKPGLQPLGVDGRPLPTVHIMTLEAKIPPYVELEPGAVATTSAGWFGWDGAPASGRVVVSWPGGSVEVAAVGPVQPDRPGDPGATNLLTSWFRLRD